ncbi:MAG: V-type ATPase subunit [Pyrobaculum sp.]
MSSVIKRPYLGPRVRGLKIKALPREKLISLIYANSLDEFINILKTTQYNITIDKLTYQNFHEFRKNLINTYLDRIKSIFLGSGTDVKSVIYLHLRYFEYDNIRNLAIAIKSGKNPEDFIIWEPLEFTRRRHILAALLGARSIEEVGERLKQLKHPAHKAFELSSKYGEDRLSIFLDRQWIEDFYSIAASQKDKSLQTFADDLKEYFNVVIVLRARLWGLTEEVNELIVGRPTPLVLSAVKDPPARFLENTATAAWGKLLIDLVAESPTMENIAVALDNMYPAYVKKLSDIYIVRFSEFSLGALAAQLEYMKAEVLMLVKAAALLSEGVAAEKRGRIFEPLVRA